MIDRRHGPGGHWLDSYPFVQLHQPSMNYGVNSTALGEDRVETDGRDAGFYERASGTEICRYYDEIMRHRLLASGRVRFFPMCDYLGDRRFRSRLTGVETGVSVRRSVVDATYMASHVPATDPPPFEVSDMARCVPVGALTSVTEPPAGYVIIGGGKTAMDAVCWLLDQGTPAHDITWIRPRDSWILNRSYFQPGDGVLTTFEGVVLHLEAVAECDSIEQVFERLEDRQVMLRIDRSIQPSMLKGATASVGELDELRRIENVIRLGHVERIDMDTITLEHGSIPTSPDHLHIHCASAGLSDNPPKPIFADDTILLQPVTRVSLSLSAGLIGLRRSLGTIDGGEEPALPAERVVPHALRLDTAPVDWDEDRNGVAGRSRRRDVGGGLAPQSREGSRSAPRQGRGGRPAESVPDCALSRPGQARCVRVARNARRARTDVPAGRVTHGGAPGEAQPSCRAARGHSPDGLAMACPAISWVSSSSMMRRRSATHVR